MTSPLTAARVRGDVDVLSRAGLSLEEFLEEAVTSVQRAVPHVATCIGTHDPQTRLLTSSRKYGDLVGTNSQDQLFGRIEYDSEETTTYRHLFARAGTAIGMHRETGGDPSRSVRMDELMMPHFGYTDEARLIFRDGDHAWGGMAMFRGPDEQPFGEAELDFLETLSTSFARGVRGGVLVRTALATAPPTSGPAVIIVGSDDQILQASAGATAWLEGERALHRRLGDPLGVVAALVGTARRLARGEETAQPVARVRTADGRWLVLHASPLSGMADRNGEVVITIEEARPPEIVALVVAAFDLTPRERDVTQLVLQGVDTKEIAATLHLSAYTVQDHLKSVFEKTDVRSRRELIARIYFDQYQPRMNTAIGTSGWFATT